ncbi:hypothetical protein TL16_g04845 [Triparma laevis f. inornata]|uniref:Calmodulin n=1 Tax=Triparma laevis f. inornata TaxID=1714386 RepID=A0A9W7E778_9STRA|nr:hypothetical protein TL16_g04845 [Triparma laevis f. inornata]
MGQCGLNRAESYKSPIVLVKNSGGEEKEVKLETMGTPPQRKLSSRKSSFKGNLVKDYSTEIKANYVIESKKILGSGASSEVVRIRHRKTSTRYALKTFFKSKSQSKQLSYYTNEISILKQVDHPNVIRLFQAYEHGRNLHMVLELCSAGNLLRVLNNQPRRRVSELQGAQFCMQILRAINYIQGVGVCHRDMKLENVMLERPCSDAQIKVIDFGYATQFKKGDAPMTSFVGTAYATAPEVFMANYTETCDLWAVGVITYAMLCGLRPFVGREILSVHNSKYKSMVRDILSGTFVWPKFASKLSEKAKDFVEGLLTVDVNKRLDVKRALQHDFITQCLDGEFKDNLTPLIPQIGQMSKFSELKKNAMMAIAFSMSQNQMEDLRDCFTSIDTDHSGTLTREEFSIALKKVMPTITSKKINEVFEAVDQDNDGEISYLEFLAATMHKNGLTMKELEDAFNVLDHDGNGYLEPADFEALLGETDEEDRERIKKMLEEADVDGDGRVSFAEFMVAMGNGEEMEANGAGLEPVDAMGVQAEKRAARLQKTSTFKRHKSDSVLEIENMKELDKELQSSFPSPATTINVQYRLRGQNSDGNKSPKMSRNMTVQAPPPKKNLASKKDIKDVMKRTSYSVSPASMANMSTPSFDGMNLIPSPLNFSPPDKKVGTGYGEKVPLPAAAIADGSKSWNAGSSSGNNGASSSLSTESLDNKETKLRPNTKLDLTNNLHFKKSNNGEELEEVQSRGLDEKKTSDDVENVDTSLNSSGKVVEEGKSPMAMPCYGSNKGKSPKGAGMPSAKFSSEASLELLVLHKSEGKNEDDAADTEAINSVKGGEEAKEVTFIVYQGDGGEDNEVGLAMESSLSETALT